MKYYTNSYINSDGSRSGKFIYRTYAAMLPTDFNSSIYSISEKK